MGGITADTVHVSGTFRLNAMLVYVSIVVDAVVGAYTDITYTFNTSLDVMAVIFQSCTFLFTVMCFYNLLSETQLVKRALFTRLADEFAPALILAALYFTLLLTVRFYRLGLVYNYYPHLQIWEEPAYTPLYAVMKCAALGYYAAVVWSMQKVMASPALFAGQHRGAGFSQLAMG
mmetsp:Transcript_39157/g.96998  ORF Transcript_39157/g.96998 Transcript_39157/m.96998 type:complete len:175 (+) Transcript_39157:62-586(+)